jgi:hypothetical protein
MIAEMRTYQLKPRSVPEVEKRFAEAMAHRTSFSPLAGFWHTETGPLNTIIHLWPYESVAERERIRAAALKPGVWPPAIGEFVDTMESKLLVPAPFSPKLEPRRLGGLYEIRSYIYKPGSIPKVIENWREPLAERVKLSPLVAAFSTEHGPLNQWIHIWAYKDAGERERIRAEAIAKGIWPPKSGGDLLLKQESWLVVPASFSPLQ